MTTPVQGTPDPKRASGKEVPAPIWPFDDEDTAEQLAAIRNMDLDEEIHELDVVVEPSGLSVQEQQLRAYASDLSKAWSSMKHLERNLEEAYLDTLVRLMRAARFRDDETGAHLIRISHYAKRVATHLALRPERVRQIAAAAPLHDVGKIGIPDAILQKSGPLNDDEWTVMQSHTRVGAALMGGTDSALIRCAGKIALCHHERFDGTGYPQGLVGNEIPLAARIVSLVDTYDALRSRRSYKPAFDEERTFDIITQGDGRTMPAHFDPTLLITFRELREDLDEIFRSHATEEER